MNLLDVFRKRNAAKAREPWVLIPVGSPALDRSETRGNLGRLMVIRWGLNRDLGITPFMVWKRGAFYQATPMVQVFLPAVSERRLWEATMELQEAGLPAERQLFLSADQRLDLGDGRLRFTEELDHPSLKTAAQVLGRRRVPRLVFGIGPVREPRDQFRAGRWSEPEWRRLEHLEAPFGRFLRLLEATDWLPDLAVKVNVPGFWSRVEGD